MTTTVLKISNNTTSNTTKHDAHMHCVRLFSSTAATIVAALMITCLPTSSAFVGTSTTSTSQTTQVGSSQSLSLNYHRSLRRTRPMGLTSSSSSSTVVGRRNSKSSSSRSSRSTTAISAFMVDEVSRAVQLFYETKPFEAAFLTCSVKASAADVIAQVREVSDDDDDSSSSTSEEHNWEPSIIANHKEKQASESNMFDPLQIMKDPSSALQSATQAVTSLSMDELYIGPIKIPRNVAFLLYGGLYCGIGQHIIYNELYPYLFGINKDIHTVAIKILFDQLIHGPFVCLPLSYIFKSVVYQESISKAIDKYTSDVTNKGLLFKYWMVWTPFELVMYNYVPSYLIIPFISMISFFWLIVLSSVANSDDVVEVDSSLSSSTSSSTSSLTVSQ